MTPEHTGAPPAFAPQTPDFESRVRDSFARQKLMATFGAQLSEVSPGLVVIEMPFSVELTQQHGYLHAGVVTSVADSACGYAALTLMPSDADVVSVEFKINRLAPARGERFVARGRVVRAGRNLSVCVGDVFALDGGASKLVATLLGTMMTVRGRAVQE
ncbi:MAG TPA: PaaI family thioesterase [Pyrinomonadaceae bacterium]|nr:PaaI family thioesterase [Pyrinomonadaceae bacterium]